MEDMINDRYAHKHADIRRMSSDFIWQLPLPFELNGFAVQADEAPYGLELFFLIDEWYLANYGAPEQDEEEEQFILFAPLALIAMALFDNCDFVTITLRDHFSFTCTREWADAVIGGDIKRQADTQEDFHRFSTKINEYAFVPFDA